MHHLITQLFARTTFATKALLLGILLSASAQPLLANCGFSIEAVLYNDANCGQSDGAAELVLQGNTAPFSFNWSGGQTTQAVSGLAAGLYTVTVTDSAACVQVLNVAISNLGAASISGLTTSPATCQAADGQIDFTATGNGPFTINWTGASTGSLSNQSSPISLVGLQAGSYVIQVVDANGCLVSTTATIGQAGGITMATTIPQNPSCGGGTNGSIQAQATTGTLPFQFFLNGAAAGGAVNQTNRVFSNLPAGVYDIRIVDGNGCAATATVILNEGGISPINAANFSFSDVTCPSGADGTAVENTPSGIVYEVFNALTDSLVGPLPQNNLSAGDYEIRRDSAGCVSLLPFTIEDPEEWLLGFEIDNPSCTAGGAFIDLTVDGATAPYTYAWSNGETTQDLNNLFPGYYNLSVTDALGCTFVEDSILISNCSTTDTVFLPPNATVTYCADTLDIAGNVGSVINICAGALNNGTIAPIGLNGCVTYTAGAVEAIDSVCVEICNGPQNFCDTTTIVFITQSLTDTLIFPVGTSQNIVACPDTTELPGLISSTTNLNCSPVTNGTVNSIDPTTGCVDYTAGNLIGNDTLCLVLCDNNTPAFCDTAIIILQVQDPVDSNTVFVAVDSSTTFCPDLSALPGTLQTATNLNCSPVNNGTLTGIDPTTGCVDYQAGALAGIDTVCVELCDNLGNCDTSIVIFSSFPNSDTSVIALPPGSAAIDTCLFGIQVPGSISSITNLNCDAQIVGGISANPITGCVSYVPPAPDPNQGMVSDTVCLVFCDNSTPTAYCDTAIFIFNNVPPNCGDVNPDSLVGQVVDCGVNALAQVCFPVPLADIGDFDIAVDDGSGVQPYNGPFGGCDLVRTVRYPLSVLAPCPGNTFEITWIFNGQVLGPVQVTGQAGIVAQLNLWDINTSWSFTANGIAEGLSSGNDNLTYGNLTVQCVGSGASPTDIGPIVQQQTALGTLLDFQGEGSYLVYFTDTLNCVDTTEVLVFCTPPSLVTDTITLSNTGSTCDALLLNIDTSDVPNIDTIFNACPGAFGNEVFFDIIDQQTACVEYTGVALGVDSACIVVCSSEGICDTTYLQITVSLDPPVLADDSLSLVFQTTTGSLDVCPNDVFSQVQYDIFVLEQPGSGVVTNTDCNFTYNLTAADYCGVDSFTYTVTNVGGADTATVYVEVPCAPFEIADAFSPNGDGFNDVFMINSLSDFPDNEVYIYNRWGNLVFYTPNYQNDWRGTFQGKDLPDGTYFYVIKLNNELGEVFTGPLLLLR